jgi:tRNA 2-thiouridine synthesizing protein C
MDNQSTDGIGMKNFSSSYKALGDYDINKMYVSKESLEERGLSEADLMPLVWEDEEDDWAEKTSIYILSNEEIKEKMSQQDVVLSF